MVSQYVGGLVEPHNSDLAVLPHPVISIAACSPDLGFQITSQLEAHSLPLLPMKVGGRTAAFPIILLKSLAWINMAQYCLEHSRGIKVFQGITSDYFGATVASNTLAGDGLFLMLDADIDTRILYWTLTAAMFNPAIDPPLVLDPHVSGRALESAGLSSLILWAKERTPGAIFHVVARLALDQWLGDAMIATTLEEGNHIKVVFPQPGTEDVYSTALSNVGDDVLIAWCFMHAQESLSAITSIGDDYSMEVWVNDHKRVETTSVGATLRGEENWAGRAAVFADVQRMIESAYVKKHPEIRRLTTDSDVSPLTIVDRVTAKAGDITRQTTVLLQKPSIPAASDLKKGDDAVLDFDVSSTWVLDNQRSIPCPAAPAPNFPNVAELGHGSAACVFVKPADVSGKQNAWIDSLVSGELTTDTVDVNRGPAYGINIKIPEKPNISGKYTLAQLVGNIDRDKARQSRIYDHIRLRIAEVVAQAGPGTEDAYSYVVTRSEADPDTGEAVDTGWFNVPRDLPVELSDIIHTDVSSQLGVSLFVPAGSVCTVVRRTNVQEHTVVYTVSAFNSEVYDGVSPVPAEPFDALKYVKLVLTTRTSPVQTVVGIFDLDGWSVYACEQLAAFYNRVSTSVKDAQTDVSSGNNKPETVGSSDSNDSWLWILLLLLAASSNNQTNITLKVDNTSSKSNADTADTSTPDDEYTISAHDSIQQPGSEAVSIPQAESDISVSEMGRAGDAANPNRTTSVKPELRR